SQVYFDFVCGASEDSGAAARTEKPPGVLPCFAIDRHRILREHRGSGKKGAMMLAAVETVTNADPVWPSRCHNSDVAAKATARVSVHAASPLKSSGRNVYNVTGLSWTMLTAGLAIPVPLRRSGTAIHAKARIDPSRLQAERKLLLKLGQLRLQPFALRRIHGGLDQLFEMRPFMEHGDLRRSHSGR